MIKSNKTLWFGSILTIALFVATFFVPSALATAEPAVSSIEAAEAEVISIETEAQSLGVDVPGRFHFLKNWVYSIQKAITFNPVKKAEIDLKQASEQLIGARVMAAETQDPKAQKKVEAALRKYENKIEKIREHSNEFNVKAPELADKFMAELTDRQIKQQEIISKLEDKMPEEAWQFMNEIREKTMEHYGVVIDRMIEDKDEIANHILGVMELQNSSDFARLKHLEILKDLEDKLPEAAISGIKYAQTDILDKFKEEIGDMPEDLMELELDDYMNRARRDSNTRMDILEEVENRNLMSDTSRENFDIIKEEYKLNIEAIKKGIENLSETEKKLLELSRDRAKEYYDDKDNRYEEIKNRLESNYDNLDEKQKDMLEKYNKRNKNTWKRNKEAYKKRYEGYKEHREDLLDLEKDINENLQEVKKKEREILNEIDENSDDKDKFSEYLDDYYDDEKEDLNDDLDDNFEDDSIDDIDDDQEDIREYQEEKGSLNF